MTKDKSHSPNLSKDIGTNNDGVETMNRSLNRSREQRTRSPRTNSPKSPGPSRWSHHKETHLLPRKEM